MWFSFSYKCKLVNKLNGEDISAPSAQNRAFRTVERGNNREGNLGHELATCGQLTNDIKTGDSPEKQGQ